jgi:hypothetical protein
MYNNGYCWTLVDIDSHRWLVNVGHRWIDGTVFGQISRPFDYWKVRRTLYAIKVRRE